MLIREMNKTDTIDHMCTRQVREAVKEEKNMMNVPLYCIEWMQKDPKHDFLLKLINLKDNNCIENDHKEMFEFAYKFLHTSGFYDKLSLNAKDIDNEIYNFGKVNDLDDLQVFKHRFIKRTCHHFEISEEKEYKYHIELMLEWGERNHEMCLFEENFIMDLMNSPTYIEYFDFQDFVLDHFDKVDLDVVRRDCQDNFELVKQYYLDEAASVKIRFSIELTLRKQNEKSLREEKKKKRRRKR